MHPDHARFSNNRFRLPPIPPVRQDYTWKSPSFFPKHCSTQESHLLPPLVLSLTHTSGSSPITSESTRPTSSPLADQPDQEPRRVFARSIVHHHHTIGEGSSLEVPCMPRRLPFRTEPSQDLPFQRVNQIGKGPWNALLGVASAEIQAQPSAIPHTKPEQPAVDQPCLCPSLPVLSSPPRVQVASAEIRARPAALSEKKPEQPIVVQPRLHRSLPVLPTPPRAQVFHHSTSAETPEKCAVATNRIDPAIAKGSRARRLAARRNAAQLKRQRQEVEEPNCLPSPQQTVPVPSVPAKSGKRNENNRRRLANRASVQKCRNKQKIRCKKLHAERDLLSEENKILKDLRDEINASGILKLKVAAAITVEGQEFLQNYNYSGLATEPIHAGRNRNTSLFNSASGHAYHSNGNNGNSVSARRCGYIHGTGNIARTNEGNAQIGSKQEDCRLYGYRHQRSEDARKQERSVARENTFHTPNGFRSRSHALPILPGIRNLPFKGIHADVGPPKMNSIFDNLSIESGDDVRDGI